MSNAARVASVNPQHNLFSMDKKEISFQEKNEHLKRPMSPYTIYKIQITSLLSITHRFTGIGLSVLLYSWGINSLMASHTNWAQQLAALHDMLPAPVIYTLKFIVVTSLAYHSANGIRHLMWDMGYGFGLRELYLSGYAVLAITLVAALYSIASY